MSFEKIKRSLKYGALDHKWLARDYLWRKKESHTVASTDDENEITD